MSDAAIRSAVIMGTYTYSIASVPGGAWNTQQNPGMSDHATDLIRANIPSMAGDNPPDNQLFTISTDTVLGIPSVIVETVTDLSDSEQVTLATIIQHGPDYFIVTVDNGATDLGEPSAIEQTAGLDSAKTVTLKWKDGAGNDSNGYGSKEVDLTPAALMPIDKTDGSFDGTGKFSFVIGASLVRGAVAINIKCDKLPERNLTAKWN
jgi:hypothetical protein